MDDYTSGVFNTLIVLVTKMGLVFRHGILCMRVVETTREPKLQVFDLRFTA
jgi:hypothetical protein